VFETHVVEAIRQVTLKPRTSDVAGKMLFEYFQANEAQLLRNVRDYKQTILALLMKGYDATDAFDMALQD
jgi:hypothetical protein